MIYVLHAGIVCAGVQEFSFFCKDIVKICLFAALGEISEEFEEESRRIITGTTIKTAFCIM